MFRMLVRKGERYRQGIVFALLTSICASCMPVHKPSFDKEGAVTGLRSRVHVAASVRENSNVPPFSSYITGVDSQDSRTYYEFSPIEAIGPVIIGGYKFLSLDKSREINAITGENDSEFVAGFVADGLATCGTYGLNATDCNISGVAGVLHPYRSGNEYSFIMNGQEWRVAIGEKVDSLESYSWIPGPFYRVRVIAAPEITSFYQQVKPYYSEKFKWTVFDSKVRYPVGFTASGKTYGRSYADVTSDVRQVKVKARATEQQEGIRGWVDAFGHAATYHNLMNSTIDQRNAQGGATGSSSSSSAGAQSSGSGSRGGGQCSSGCSTTCSDGHTLCGSILNGKCFFEQKCHR